MPPVNTFRYYYAFDENDVLTTITLSTTVCMYTMIYASTAVPLNSAESRFKSKVQVILQYARNSVTNIYFLLSLLIAFR